MTEKNKDKLTFGFMYDHIDGFKKSAENYLDKPDKFEAEKYKYIRTVLDQNDSIVLYGIRFENPIEIYPDEPSRNSVDGYASYRDCVDAAGLREEPGVYIWLDLKERIPVYVGEAINLKKRFEQYSKLSKSACGPHGQKTNAFRSKKVSEGNKYKVYFYKTSHHRDVEAYLLSCKSENEKKYFEENKKV